MSLCRHVCLLIVSFIFCAISFSYLRVQYCESFVKQTRNSIDALISDRPHCLLDHEAVQLLGDVSVSRRLELGQWHVVGSNRQTNGSFDKCIFCQCTMNMPVDGAFLNCEMNNCPYHLCEPQQDYNNPHHPCCSICDRSSHSPVDAPLQSAINAATIDPSVRLTAELYDRRMIHVPRCLHNQTSAIIGVLSLPSSTARRRVMRKLFGALLASNGMRLVFVLGRQRRVPVVSPHNWFPPDDDSQQYGSDETSSEPAAGVMAEQDAAVQRHVDDEAVEHGDILQSHVVEHYYHLTLKTLSLLQYAASAGQGQCGPFNVLLKTDDDVWLNVRRLVRDLPRLKSGVHGHGCGSCAVGRHRFSWRVSPREWPFNTFPRFVLGPGYAISRDWLAPLFQHALVTHYLHLEDVFITGVVAEKVAAPRHVWQAGLCSNSLAASGVGDASCDVCSLTQCALTHRIDYVQLDRRLQLFQYAAFIMPVEEICAGLGPNQTSAR